MPSAVTHSDFWERYYYKVHQLQQDEKRKADLKNRADKLKEDQAWDEGLLGVEHSITESDHYTITLTLEAVTDQASILSD